MDFSSSDFSFSQYGHQADDDLLSTPFGQRIRSFDDPLTKGGVMTFLPIYRPITILLHFSIILA